jgi:Zn-dependent M28 family amino/carboxypeptidase
MNPKILWSTVFLVLVVLFVWSIPAKRIEKDRLSGIVRQLASDEFQGRAPGTVGEMRTLAYLTEYFSSLGLSPGGNQGSWVQAVPLIHTQLQVPFHVAIHSGEAHWQLQQATDLEVSTIQATSHVRIQDAPLVFVGFGASAPERDWDDYGDIDLNGKVAIFLVNDPDFAAQPGEAVVNRFGNRRMTYYGRWTYKFEEAARRGAIAALVIHEDKAAGYGWNVASSSPGENYSIVNTGVTQNGLKLQGWLHGDAATRLFEIAGLDLQQLRTAARQPQFEAFTLDKVSFSADLAVKLESIESQNLLARLPGTDQGDETIMVSAHWDAYGIGAADEQGRVVRPGANDDALGVAGVMELARVLKQGPTPARSIVFALWTAEESGLLGSAFYAQNPIYPTAKTVANFTLDILQTAGLARDVILVGEGQSELESDLARAALTQGRTVTPESLPENGLFFRADHFSLAKEGVPVLLLMGIAGGADLVEGGRSAGDQWVTDYISGCYHQTCDAWDPAWDLSGAVQDVELFQWIIEDLADSRRWPEWKEGSEFKAIRQQSSHQRQ